MVMNTMKIVLMTPKTLSPRVWETETFSAVCMLLPPYHSEVSLTLRATMLTMATRTKLTMDWDRPTAVEKLY